MKLLVLIDVQNDFIDGALANKEAQVAVKNIPSLIRNNEWDNIYYTLDTHYDDYINTAEGKKLPVPHCIVSTHGWQLNEEVNKALSDKKNERVVKNTFGSVLLPYIIQDEYGPRKGLPKKEPVNLDITIAGFCTDICVVSNALILKANFPNAKISVVADCCAGVTPEKHEAALEVMRSCQIDII